MKDRKNKHFKKKRAKQTQRPTQKQHHASWLGEQALQHNRCTANNYTDCTQRPRSARRSARRTDMDVSRFITLFASLGWLGPIRHQSPVSILWCVIAEWLMMCYRNRTLHPICRTAIGNWNGTAWFSWTNGKKMPQIVTLWYCDK